MSGRTHGRSAVAAAAVAAALALAGCGGGTDTAAPPAAAGPTFTQGDMDFAVALSQHHSQALAMAELARTRAGSARVKGIAAEVEQVKAAEVDVLAEWMSVWSSAGAQTPPHGSGHEETEPGMLPAADVEKLERLSGRRFDASYLNLMARHHEGALLLTADEIAGGVNPEAIDLARQIQDSTPPYVTTEGTRS